MNIDGLSTPSVEDVIWNYTGGWWVVGGRYTHVYHGQLVLNKNASVKH